MDLSLLEAIKQKYCPDEVGVDRNTLPAHKPVRETATIYRPGGRPVHLITSMVLDNVGITRVINCKELSELCPNLLELHLAANQITSWNSVVTLLNAFPKLKFLDLSQNLLMFTSLVDQDPQHDHTTSHASLATLVLNSTMITWAMLQDLLVILPNLQELHLSLNSADIVPTSLTVEFPSIKLLYVNKCGLSSWEDFCRLSGVFPCLEQLIADSNPLQQIATTPQHSSSNVLQASECIDEASGQVVVKRSVESSKDGAAIDYGQFKNCSLETANGIRSPSPFSCLKYLNINNCQLSTWEDIDALGRLQSLTEASLLSVPIGDSLNEKECRMTYISRLQQLRKLNKSSISDEEREAAERWFIRLHLNNPNPPEVYSTLVKRHGNLLPLAEVNLGAKETVKLRFTFHNITERPPEDYEIDLEMTAQELRLWIGKELLQVPSNTISMYYVDKNQAADGYGPELIIPSNKPLSSYRMAEGDEIDVKYLSDNDLYFQTYQC